MTTESKARILLILDYLRLLTDETHCITTEDIQNRLDEDGLPCDRKTVYREIKALMDYGYDIEQNSTRTGGGYRLISREFENAELKLLVDAVSSSRFITSKKSKNIIDKLEKLCSRYDAVALARQVYVTGRVKSDNESILYQIDSIHRAMQENCKISFHYYVWNLNKELVDKDNLPRTVSPFALIWEDENYYLLAKDEKDGIFKHFRVDKMAQVEVLSSNYRNGLEEFQKIDMGEYSNETFGMYGGQKEYVTLVCPNYLIGVMIDRFGKAITTRKIDDQNFSARVKVALSNQFFGWITGLGGDVRIQEPKEVAQKYTDYLTRIIHNHES